MPNFSFGGLSILDLWVAAVPAPSGGGSERELFLSLKVVFLTSRELFSPTSTIPPTPGKGGNSFFGICF